MRKKLKCTVLLGTIALLCFGTGCAVKSEVEKNKEKGYKISVVYDPNGGSFLELPNITIMDMFNPDHYEADSNGEVHIKLTEPTDPSRPTSTDDPIELHLQSHFFAGWYQTRELRTTAEGAPVDWNGKELALLEDGRFVYADTVTDEAPTEAVPAYNYSGYWDFENDRIDYSEEDGFVEMRLYAGWVPYYEFHYYYEKEAGVWEKLEDVTTFNYKTTNSDEYPKEADKDMIYLPEWDNGAMNYSHLYQSGSEYLFPSVIDTTFLKAYADADRTQEIVTSFEHPGTLEPCYGENKELRVENRIQNIYIEVEAGEQYRIETAEQLALHANRKGHYTIYNDLDFTGKTWPAAFSAGEFAGSMKGKDGKAITFKNIDVAYGSDGKYGGLFGKLGAGASLTKISFENVTVTLNSIGTRNHGAQFGLFAGMIDEGATLTDVSLQNATLKIGAIGYANDLAFHLIANGNASAVKTELETLHLSVFGVLLIDVYEYTVNPEKVTVEEGGKISLEFYPSSSRLNQEIYIIQ